MKTDPGVSLPEAFLMLIGFEGEDIGLESVGLPTVGELEALVEVEGWGMASVDAEAPSFELQSPPGAEKAD